MFKATMFNATTFKATTAIVSLLVVACVCAFFHPASALLAGAGIASALFLILVLVLIATIERTDWRPNRRLGKPLLRYAAPGMMVLLGCGTSWASFSLTFQGLVQTLNMAGITLNGPAGVVVDAAGDVYIADTGNSRIVEVSTQGVASVVTITGLSPVLSSPRGIALDGSGNLYVADAGNNRVVEISAAGAGSVIATGSVTLSSPKGVALDQSGNLFIADTTNNRIVEVTAGGSAAALVITVSSGPATLSGPVGLSVDVTGKLYISDSNHNRIVTVAAGSTTGVVASILGGVTLNTPSAVTVDRMGNVFIADTGNSRIAEIDTSGNGTVLYTGSATLNGPEGVALDVFGTVYIADTGDNQALAVDPPVNGDLTSSDPTYSLNKTAVGFGHITLGSSTAVTQTLTFTTGQTALGSVQVLTSGVVSLDFISGTETTCNGSTGTSTVCVVEVTYLPTAPGLRSGSVVLYDTDMNPILTVPLYGWSDAPVAALSSNLGTVISTGVLTLASPYQVALDGAGNIYVGDDGSSNVTRIPAGGGTATVVNLGSPGTIAPNEIDGVAVDGAGNLFIADHENNRILVVTPAGVVSVLTINGLSPALGEPLTLALDGAGNLYIADYSRGRIVRVSTLVVAGSTSSGLGTAIGTGAFTFAGQTINGMTVDGQGNIYIAAPTQNGGNIIKVTTAGVASELSLPGLTPAVHNAAGVNVDAMGNVYVVDTDNRRIVELTTAGVVSAVSISGLPAPPALGSTLFGVTPDPFGNLYISDWSNNRIVFVNVSGSVLAFPSTDVGSTSSPQTATVANLGDLPLIFATVPTYTLNFSEDTGDENLCTVSTSLLPGTLCDVSVEFTPQSAGSLSTGIVVTNNSLNVTGTTENVAVSGTGIAVADTTAVAVSTNPTSVVLGQTITITAVVTDTTTGDTGMIPTGGVTFMDTVGSTVISLNSGNPVTLDGSGQATLTGVTLAGTGQHTITASYAGVSGAFLASTNTTTIQVSPLLTALQDVVNVLSTGGITLSNATDVIVDGQGDIYIADDGNNQIVEVSAAGVASVVAFPGLSPALHNPQAVALDGAGNLFVADGPNARVVELSGGVASVVNTGGLLSYPDGVVVDASGNLYIADAGNNSIVEVPAGGVAAVLGITGLDTPLNSPGNIAVDALGNLYIADASNNRIVVVAPGGAGTVLGITGGLTLSLPLGVAVDGAGNVYIADRNNNRIVTVTPGGMGSVLSVGTTTLHFPRGVAVNSFGTVYIADNNGGSRIVEVQPSAVGFGHLALGASSGTTLTLPFSVGASSTLGSVQALTLGTLGLDFAVVADGTTCVAGTTDVLSCNVVIQFLPTAAGLRRGEVVLFDQSVPPIPLLSVSLYGTGDAPLAALSPGTASVIGTGNVSMNFPYQIALDGAGNLYVANIGGNNVVKVAAGGGSASVVSTGLITVASVGGVALDGAGNLYIPDQNNNLIVEVTPAGVASVLAISGLSEALSSPITPVFDAAGNLYIVDTNNNRIVKVTPAGVGSVVATGGITLGAEGASGVAVDAAGTVYIADATNNDVVKVTADGEASLVALSGIVPAGLNTPLGVSVDGMGNLYIADSFNNRIVEVTTAGVASVVQTATLTNPPSLTAPRGVAVDGSGNIFIPDSVNNRLVEVNVSSASLVFPNTDVGANSVPQTATVTNIGDLPLVISAGPSYTANFPVNLEDSNLCAASTSLAAGTACDISAFFSPQSAGLLNASVGLTGNSLNVSGATESIAVSGTGVSAAGDSTQTTVSTTPTSVVSGQTLTVTATVIDTAAGDTATVPTGTVTITDTLGSTTVTLNGGTAVTLNGSGLAILTGVTLNGVGLHTITAVYPGANGAFLPSAALNYTLVTAAGLTVPTINWTAPAGGISYGATLSGILNATAVSGSTAVAGTFTYTATLTGGSPIAVTSATILGAGSYTLTATFTPSDPTTYASAEASISLSVAKVTPIVALISSASSVPLATAVTFTATVSFSAGTPGGSVSFYDGTTLLGAGTLAVGVATYTTSNLAVGVHSITAAYGGDSNFSALTSTVLTETVTAPIAITTATTLTASPDPLADGQPATLTATVTPAPTGTPAGIVSFYSGTTLLGTGTLNASGVATFTTSSLVVGADSITAVYPGNAGFAASTSSAVSETVTTAFTVTAPTTPVPVAPGGAATINITLPPLGGAFDSVVTLSASGLPAGATVTFNPPTVTPGAAGATTVMTIQLASATASIPASLGPGNPGPSNLGPGNHGGVPMVPLSLGLLVFGAVLGRKRIPRMLVVILALASLGITTSLFTGCGGGFSSLPSTRAGNYTVTVTGTSGALQESTTVTLTVE